MMNKMKNVEEPNRMKIGTHPYRKVLLPTIIFSIVLIAVVLTAMSVIKSVRTWVSHTDGSDSYAARKHYSDS